ARYAEDAVDPAKLGTFKEKIEQSLANIDRYTKGIRELFTQYGIDKLDGAPAALDALEKQLKDYADWTRTVVLPRAATDFRQPAEIYADNLKNVGLDIPPEELMQK